MAEFKPNIYPIIYWSLLYGLVAGFGLFAVFLLSQFITVIWFPVFLVGVIWGGYRNYKKQKSQAGHASKAQTPIGEIKEAARDIVSATREMMAEQVVEDQAAAQAEEAAVAEQEAAAPVDAPPPAPLQTQPQPQTPEAPPAPPVSDEQRRQTTDQPSP